MSSIGNKELSAVYVGEKEVKTIYVGQNKVYENAVNPDPIFGNNSPDIISQVSKIIAANNYTSAQVATIYGWNLGDLIDITLSNNETIQMQIIGINHDTLSSDHTTKAGITLQMKDLLATKYAMNDDHINAGGWAASIIRTSTIPTLLALLPDEWQAVIKNVDKKTANGGGKNYSATNTTSESLFLLSEIEIFETVTYAQDGDNEGSQYEFYANGGSKIKKINDVGTNWWGRSCYYSSINNFCAVKYDGNDITGSAGSAWGVSFAFCV